MVKITNHTNEFYYPPDNFKGLEELVRFPDGEYKQTGIPNSSIWVFNSNGHNYVPEIIGNDAGCGMAAFLVSRINPAQAADKIAEFLKDKNILGRGNHFVDICTSFKINNNEDPTSNIILLHTDGKSYDSAIPTSLEEADKKIKAAEKFREELGYKLSRLIGAAACSIVGNWTHNSIEEKNGKVLYRKGIVKIEPKKVYVLPAHLNSEILVYTVGENNSLPYSSMPHATGRAGPRGIKKVSLEKAADIRKLVYIPKIISGNSLRSEHPSCYNNYKKIMDIFFKEIVPISSIRILGYVGKI